MFTIAQFIKWCEEHHVDIHRASLCVQWGEGALIQVVNRTNLSTDHDGDVIITP